MLNINSEKQKVKEYENKIRTLEMNKVRNEEAKRNAEIRIKELEEEMVSLGVSPDTIDQNIKSLESNIAELKNKIDRSLNIEDEEESEFRF